jgi:exosortase/archaeosortase family protein
MQIGIKNSAAVRFGITFLVLFVLFYYANIFFFGLTTRHNNYSLFLTEHLNYIAWLRHALLTSSATLLNWLSYSSVASDTQLLVAGHGRIEMVYTCLGLGVMSFFAAFVIAYPKKIKAKLIFLFTGILVIQILNIFRLMLLALFWTKSKNRIIDHHVIFDVVIYILISVALYYWINNKATNTNGHH